MAFARLKQRRFAGKECPMVLTEWLEPEGKTKLDDSDAHLVVALSDQLDSLREASAEEEDKIPIRPGEVDMLVARYLMRVSNNGPTPTASRVLYCDTDSEGGVSPSKSRSRLISELSGKSTTSPGWKSSTGETWATGYDACVKLSFDKWIFRTVIELFREGVLKSFMVHNISGDEALAGLRETWPSTSNFLTNIFEAKNTVYKLTEAPNGCIKVVASAKLDLAALKKNYPHVAQVIRLLACIRGHILASCGRSCLADLAELAPADRRGPSVMLEQGEISLIYVAYKGCAVWTDPEGKPVLAEGRPIQIEPPIAPRGSPKPHILTVDLHVDKLQLGLRDFACLGMSTVKLPHILATASIASTPVYDGSDDVAASISVAVLDIGAFPGERFMRPLFDTKQMRQLVVDHFEVTWTMGPGGIAHGLTGKEDAPWQLINTISLAVPRVARVFKVCLRSFLQSQATETETFRLWSEIFRRIHDDIRAEAEEEASDGEEYAGSEAED